MMIRLFLLLLAVLPIAVPVDAALLDMLIKRPAAPPPSVSVLVLHDSPGAIVEVKGKYRLYDPINYCYISTRLIGKRRFMQVLSDGLQWGEEFPGMHQIMIVPDNQAVSTIVDGKEYRGSLYIYDVEGTIGVVNEVDLEEYLHSVLAYQANEDMPQEALAAMAIVARTYAYYYLNNPPTSFWAVNGEKTGYQGYAQIIPSSRVAQAVAKTRYLVMSRGGDEQGAVNPFPAQFGEGKADGVSKLSMQEVIEMARKGQHAAQILEKAFPNTKIVLIHSP